MTMPKTVEQAVNDERFEQRGSLTRQRGPGPFWDWRPVQPGRDWSSSPQDECRNANPDVAKQLT